MIANAFWRKTMEGKIVHDGSLFRYWVHGACDPTNIKAKKRHPLCNISIIKEDWMWLKEIKF